MYIPQHYKNEDIAEIKDFLKENGFGILVNITDGRPWATHIPLELDIDENGKDVLVGHISKANLQWKDFTGDKEVLCIFNGPHSYISSSWYKEEDVPTWNYIAVHVYGTLNILKEKAVLNSLNKLVDKYEQRSKEPVSLHHMSPQTLRQVKGIIGFQITITDIQAAYKLSQTRKHDIPKIVQELESTKDPNAKSVANAMKKRK